MPHLLDRTQTHKRTAPTRTRAAATIPSSTRTQTLTHRGRLICIIALPFVILLPPNGQRPDRPEVISALASTALSSPLRFSPRGSSAAALLPSPLSNSSVPNSNSNSDVVDDGDVGLFAATRAAAVRENAAAAAGVASSPHTTTNAGDSPAEARGAEVTPTAATRAAWAGAGTLLRPECLCRCHSCLHERDTCTQHSNTCSCRSPPPLLPADEGDEVSGGSSSPHRSFHVEVDGGGGGGAGAAAIGATNAYGAHPLGLGGNCPPYCFYYTTNVFSLSAFFAALLRVHLRRRGALLWHWHCSWRRRPR